MQLLNMNIRIERRNKWIKSDLYIKSIKSGVTEVCRDSALRLLTWLFIQ